MRFTTRPEIAGTFGVVASTHWIASAVGMSVLEKGGNAFDAAVATGFTLQVVEPHLNGPAGEVPALIRLAGEDRARVLCGQGVAPERATIAHYRGEGLEMIPGSGLLATVTPGAFDAWMLMLRDHGSMELRDVLAPAIRYAEAGHPLLPRVAQAIAGLAEFFRAEWPSSAETWAPGGAAPEPGVLFRNPALAETWRRILAEADSGANREARIERARAAFAEGFVAETIDRFVATTEAMDAAGGRRKGVLTGDDMARWRASWEEPVSADYGDWTLCKTGFWGQGPLLLQALRILEGLDIGAMDGDGPDFVHAVVETLKLAMADREAFYGEPHGSELPYDTLLSRDYAAARRAQIGREASHDQRPGLLPGFERLAEAAVARAARPAPGGPGTGAGEPTMAHRAERRAPDPSQTARRGDTVHLDVIDRWGNMVAATPSGGWLQSSPVVPGLGFPLNSRAQMFWLDEGLPSSLAPGRRPRTTLSPSLALHEGRPALAFGTPGGDQQDQWQLVFFLRHVHQGLNLQEAIDAPLFHTSHVTGSFYPRPARPGVVMIEETAGERVLDALRLRGHEIEVADAWTVGRLTAAGRGPDGVLRAAATPRLMQAYALGR